MQHCSDFGSHKTGSSVGVMVSSLLNNEHSKICKKVLAHSNTKIMVGVTFKTPRILRITFICNLQFGHGLIAYSQFFDF